MLITLNSVTVNGTLYLRIDVARNNDGSYVWPEDAAFRKWIDQYLQRKDQMITPKELDAFPERVIKCMKACSVPEGEFSRTDQTAVRNGFSRALRIELSERQYRGGRSTPIGTLAVDRPTS